MYRSLEVPKLSWQKLVAASVVFFVFSLYIWLVQLKYESTAVGYERALLFSLGVLGAGVSYDSFKKILFLAPTPFQKFWKHFCSLSMDLFAIIILFVVSAVLMSFEPVFWLGQIVYVIAIGWVLSFIVSGSNVIDAATDD